jgi:hypothetical protein
LHNNFSSLLFLYIYLHLPLPLPQTCMQRHEAVYLKQEKEKKEAFQQTVKQKLQAVPLLLDSLMSSGAMTIDTKWRELSASSNFLTSTAMQELSALFKLESSSSSDGGSSSSSSSSSSSAAEAEAEEAEAMSAALELCKELYYKFHDDAVDTHRADRRLVKDLCHELGVAIAHDSALQALQAAIARILQPDLEAIRDDVARRVEVAYRERVERERIEKQKLKEKQREMLEAQKKVQEEEEVEEGEEMEEGEEREDEPPEEAENPADISIAATAYANSAATAAVAAAVAKRDSQIAVEYQQMNTSRPWAMLPVFDDLLQDAKEDHEEQLRAEKKFVALLSDTLSSEHVGVSWSDAKRKLQKRSAYEALRSSDRIRLFDTYMQVTKKCC